MIKNLTKISLPQVITISSPLILLLIWEFCSQFSILDPRFFPAPTLILTKLIQMGESGDLFTHIYVSLTRIIIGFALGVIPAICIGLLMGMYKYFRHFFSPIIMIFMPIPTLAMLPIILILFGIGEFSKMITIAISVFFPVAINTAAGVANIDRIYLDVAKNYHANVKDFFFKIAFPGALPVMLEGIQMGASDRITNHRCCRNDRRHFWDWIFNLDELQSFSIAGNVRWAHPHFIFWIFFLIIT
ncbi:ABC-type nitrate/sulfonate/bicarbonate transport system [Gracilibacillus boraciitolerans JCM 21714]|uniref:ABC-type nitrate/sulfonate/bicarbonate transport system n=1 Tax=Gracilibacillus boraciitolerans JCM 21714 TaxID=1298598 RepID=W4VFH5_9BACI|nr:ABC-type nitrate/sulfonate/bicarbonate transport system [Gracilibacillus boraciitolerans JCM 21714]